MLKVAIVDDDINLCTLLKEKLHLIIYMKHEITTFCSYKDFLASECNYDIVIMDYNFPTGENGYDVIYKYLLHRTVNPFIILLTSCDKSSIILDGYRYNLFRFVLKDNLEKDITEAMNSIMRIMVQRAGSITVKSHKTIYRINFADLLCVYSEKNNLIFVLENSNIESRMSLNDISEKLLENGFAHADSNTLVNIMHITSYDNKTIYLHNKQKVKMSRSGKKEISSLFRKMRN